VEYLSKNIMRIIKINTGRIYFINMKDNSDYFDYYSTFFLNNFEFYDKKTQRELK
jgi:hypothetical protein